MKISVLIHNLNRSSAVDRCLASVAAQTYRPLEVIVLEAGSSDDSLRVIEQAFQGMHDVGIEGKVIPCEQMGVAASRNFAARHATGDLLCFIDNDADFVTSDCLSRAADHFVENAQLAVVGFQVRKDDTGEIDPVTWVYRRSRTLWAGRQFKTFNFVGTGFCVRAKAFREVGGFWEHLRYGREEEDLTLALVDKDWELLYSPAVAIRHYPEPKGRMSLAERRFTELRNGILVLWRRLPAPLAPLAIAGRICTMSLTARREKVSVLFLIGAVPQAFAEWRRSRLRRLPVTFRCFLRYATLHLSVHREETDMQTVTGLDGNNGALRSSESDVR